MWVPQLVVRYDFSSITTSNNCFKKNGALIQLSPGNPNIYNVLQELKTKGIEAIYEEASNRLQFVTTSPYTLDFDVPNSAADLLGFNEQAYTVTNGFLSPELVKLGVFDVIYLETNIFTNNLELDEDLRTTISRKLCPIPVASKPYSNIIFVDTEGTYALFLRQIKNLSSLELSLVDASGNKLDLKRDWYLTLMVETYEDDASQTLEVLQAIRGLSKSQIDLAKLQLVGTARAR